MPYRRIFLAALVIFLTVEAAPSAEKVGREFKITRGRDSGSAPEIVALRGTRNYAAVWDASGSSSKGVDIYGAILDSRGRKITEPFVVNTYLKGGQILPSVASLGNNTFVVVWRSRNNIGGQIFTDTGEKVGSEFEIKVRMKYNSAFEPTVAALKDGGFIVVYDQPGTSSKNYGIYWQRFDEAGNPIGGRHRAQKAFAENSVFGLDNGGFAITWHDYVKGYPDVFAQLYDEKGKEVGSVIQVNTYRKKSQEYPDGVSLTNGDFVVTWASEDQDGDFRGIYAQRFGIDGTKKGPEFRVNSTTKYSQQTPRIGRLDSGGFVIIWITPRQGIVYAQPFRNSGEKAGPEIDFYNPKKGEDQFLGSIASSHRKKFIVTWRYYYSDGWGQRLK